MLPVRKAGAGLAGAGLLLAAMGPLAGGASARPSCDAGWRFEHPRRVDRKLVVFDREHNENNTGNAIQTELKATHGGTVSYSVSGAFGANAEASFFDVIKFSVQSNLNIKVERSVHAEVGNSVSVRIKPHHAVDGHYGVFKFVVRGHLFYLTKTCERQHNRPRARVKLPNAVGWRVSSHRIHRH